HLEYRRLSHGSKPMVSSGDAELDTLAERLTNRAAAECTTQQVKRIKELKEDLARRGGGSGLEQQGYLRIAIAYIDEFSERMLKDLLDVIRKAHGGVTADGAKWIRLRLEQNLDQLSTGQAGCYVKDHPQRKSLEDYIQRKKAGIAAALEIEVGTANLGKKRQA